MDALTEEAARKKSAADAAARNAARSEEAVAKVTALLRSLKRSGLDVPAKLWPENLTADTRSQLTEALHAIEKPLEERYFAARQTAAELAEAQNRKRTELDAVSGGKWVYPHGDAATRVRDAVNAELKSRGMQPDAKIFCELLSVADESWQDCVEACLGDRRFDILVPPAHYAAAKSAFVALREQVGPISLLDTPGIRGRTAVPKRLLPTVWPRRSPAKTRWRRSMPTPSSGGSSAATRRTRWNTIPTVPPAICCAIIPSGWNGCARPSGTSVWTPAAPVPEHCRRRSKPLAAAARPHSRPKAA
ncbi:MAG: hypothetical protein ACLVBX_01925 [Faecalibacterium prausnitzii]